MLEYTYDEEFIKLIQEASRYFITRVKDFEENFRGSFSRTETNIDKYIDKIEKELLPEIPKRVISGENNISLLSLVLDFYNDQIENWYTVISRTSDIKIDNDHIQTQRRLVHKHQENIRKLFDMPQIKLED